MLIKYDLITDLEMNTLEDLHKLKPLIDNCGLKVNKSELAREFNCDWKTINKYIHGFEKKKTSTKPSLLDNYYQTIMVSLVHKVISDITLLNIQSSTVTSKTTKKC